MEYETVEGYMCWVWNVDKTVRWAGAIQYVYGFSEDWVGW